MKLYTVSAIIGYETRMLKGKKVELPIVDGIISSYDRCKEWAFGHDKASQIKKWRGGGKNTHKKSLSGKNIKAKKERKKRAA